MDKNEILKKVKDRLASISQERAAEKSKLEQERKDLITSLGSNISDLVGPALMNMAEQGRMSREDIKSALQEALSGINIQSPEVKIPEFKIPTPQVTVNVPKSEAPVVNVAPTPVTFPSAMRLQPNEKPFPVIMVDQVGKPMAFNGGGSAGPSFPMAAFRPSDNTIAVSGSFSISASNSSTQAIDSSGNPYSQANPFPVVFGSSGTTGTNLVDSSGVAYSGSNPVPVVFGASATQAVNLVDSTGVAYSGSNPVPVSNIGLAVAQGDSATALRVVIAGDVASSVAVGPASGGADSLTNNQIIPTGSNGTSAPLVTAMFAFNGSSFDRVRNSSGEGGGLRIQQATDSVSSVNIVGPVNQGDVATAIRVVQAGNVASSVMSAATGLNETTNDVIRVVSMSDTSSSAQMKAIAMTALPTAVSDTAQSFVKSDKLGRAINRPVNARDLIATAYVTLSTGTETTLLTAAAGQYIDLIGIVCANTSSAAVQIDVRAGSGGNIVQTIEVPGSGTAGWAPPVPWPQDATGNAWTVDMPDITNSNVLISALFSKES
jgi:hypothetical protein